MNDVASNKSEDNDTSPNKKISKVRVSLILGHTASLSEDITSDEKTHYWSFYVCGEGSSKIECFIEKVTFTLHESFANPVQVITQPPYEIHEQGYGTFLMHVEVKFRNKRDPKKIKYNYDLLLPAIGAPSIKRSRKELITFKNTNSDFMSKLLEGGGVLYHYDKNGNLLDEPNVSTHDSDNEVTSISEFTSLSEFTSENSSSSPTKEIKVEKVETPPPITIPDSNNESNVLPSSMDVDEDIVELEHREFSITEFSQMFPNLDGTFIRKVLKRNNGVVSTAIDELLALSITSEVSGSGGDTGDFNAVLAEQSRIFDETKINKIQDELMQVLDDNSNSHEAMVTSETEQQSTSSSSGVRTSAFSSYIPAPDLAVNSFLNSSSNVDPYAKYSTITTTAPGPSSASSDPVTNNLPDPTVDTFFNHVNSSSDPNSTNIAPSVTSTTSDNLPFSIQYTLGREPGRKKFLQQYQDFHHEKQGKLCTEVPIVDIVHNIPLDLYRLCKEVCLRGGFMRLNNGSQTEWEEILLHALNLRGDTNAVQTVKSLYAKYLYPFETHNCKTLNVVNSATNAVNTATNAVNTATNAVSSSAQTNQSSAFSTVVSSTSPAGNDGTAAVPQIEDLRRSKNKHKVRRLNAAAAGSSGASSGITRTPPKKGSSSSIPSTSAGGTSSAYSTPISTSSSTRSPSKPSINISRLKSGTSVSFNGGSVTLPVPPLPNPQTLKTPNFNYNAAWGLGAMNRMSQAGYDNEKIKAVISKKMSQAGYDNAIISAVVNSHVTRGYSHPFKVTIAPISSSMSASRLKSVAAVPAAVPVLRPFQPATKPPPVIVSDQPPRASLGGVSLFSSNADDPSNRVEYTEQDRVTREDSVEQLRLARQELANTSVKLDFGQPTLDLALNNCYFSLEPLIVSDPDYGRITEKCKTFFHLYANCTVEIKEIMKINCPENKVCYWEKATQATLPPVHVELYKADTTLSRAFINTFKSVDEIYTLLADKNLSSTYELFKYANPEVSGKCTLIIVDVLMEHQIDPNDDQAGAEGPSQYLVCSKDQIQLKYVVNLVVKKIAIPLKTSPYSDVPDIIASQNDGVLEVDIGAFDFRNASDPYSDILLKATALYDGAYRHGYDRGGRYDHYKQFKKIRHIGIVVCKDIWNKYEANLKGLQENGGREIYGYHATSPKNVQSIAQHNLDPNIVAANGRTHGDGCYFSEHPEFSFRYNRQCMFIFKLILLPRKHKIVKPSEQGYCEQIIMWDNALFKPVYVLYF